MFNHSSSSNILIGYILRYVNFVMTIVEDHFHALLNLSFHSRFRKHSISDADPVRAVCPLCIGDIHTDEDAVVTRKK